MESNYPSKVTNGNDLKSCISVALTIPGFILINGHIVNISIKQERCAGCTEKHCTICNSYLKYYVTVLLEYVNSVIIILK